MTNVLKRLREKAGGAPCAGVLAAVLLLGAGPGIAAEWQVRMPVQKTARIAPQGETAQGEKPAEGLYGDKPAAKAPAKAAEAAKSEAPAKSAPKTALGRAAEAAASPKTGPHAAAEKSGGAQAAQEKVAAPAPAKPGVKTEPKPEAKPLAQANAPAKKGPAPGKSAPGALAADPDASSPAQAGTQTPPLVAAPAKAAKSAPAALDPKAKLMPPAPADAPTPLALPTTGKWVGDVHVEFQAENIVLHAATNAEVQRVTWFNLSEASGARKLAIDLRGPWHKKGASVLRFDVGPVKHIVVGEHEDRLRLSVEFRAGAVARELDPVLVRGAQGFSLTIPLAVRLAP